MATIRPFKAWRYASDQTDISALTAPPYDVMDEAERDAMAAKNPHNVVELELAKGAQDLETPGNRYVTAEATWKKWIEEGVVKQDDEPAVYVLEQKFTALDKEYARTCFIVESDLYAFDEKVIIPHELTLPKALGDRYRLLSKTNVNFSQVLGLYSDKSDGYNQLLAEAKATQPVATATDAKDVKSTLWKITDKSFIERYVASLDGKQIFIADGHHRYTVALAWRDYCREQAAAGNFIGGKDANGNPLTDSVVIALANMDDPQLLILAYNRAVKAEGEFDAQAFTQEVAKYFDIKDGSRDDLAKCERPAYLMGLKGQGLKLIELKSDVDVDEAIPGEHSKDWKSLDVSVLHELLIKPLLNVSPDAPETLSRIAYSESDDKLLARLDDDSSDIVFLLRPTRMDQLQAVSLGGETMPQKSTFFYPKLPSGFVFRSME